MYIFLILSVNSFYIYIDFYMQSELRHLLRLVVDKYADSKMGLNNVCKGI